MAALSPRSTNIHIVPKLAPKMKPSAAPKPKEHAAPPPEVIYEPGIVSEKYYTGRMLGKGGFAVCYEAELARNKRVFALKVVKKSMQSAKMEAKFCTELQIHSKMRHPHIVEFYRAFTYYDNTYVVLELCPNGSIMDMIKIRKCLSLPEIRRYLVQLCGAMKYLHSREVAHRDLKIANLFLDEKMNVKVGDFGLAAVVQTDFDGDQQRRQTFCGTPNYIAPEVLDRSHKGHTEKVDIWSIGVICFVMLTGITPFASKTQEDIYKKVRKLDYVWPKDTANYIPEEAKALVSSCLDLKEEMRPSPDAIVEQDFFSMYAGCIPRSLDSGCRNRKPLWLKNEDPRGDRMIPGYTLADDPDYAGVSTSRRATAEARYEAVKARFYSDCGVGRDDNRSSRPAIGFNAGKSAFEECFDEDTKKLSPTAPLPADKIYTGYEISCADWSTAEPAWMVNRIAPAQPARTRTVRSNAEMLASEMMTRSRRVDNQPPLSHAATLRQQARPKRQAPPAPVTKSSVPVPFPEDGSRGLMNQPPVRPLSRSTSSAAIRTVKVPAQLVRTESVPMIESRSAKTRSQTAAAPVKDQAQAAAAAAAQKVTQPEKAVLDPIYRTSVRPTPQQIQQETVRARGDNPSKTRAVPSSRFIESNEVSAIVSGTRRTDVIESLRLLYKNLTAEPAPAPSTVKQKNAEIRKVRSLVRNGQQNSHIYVMKWVDYTNRYGIGYIMGDGTVGCVFRADADLPSTCVTVRGGEQHIKRKKMDWYQEKHQLVPQKNGQDIEFYEIAREEGIRRVFVDPKVFDMDLKDKDLKDFGSGSGKANREKWRRVKLVDAFGGYMIGSLGRDNKDAEAKPDDEDEITQKVDPDTAQFVKFYQRLGNVGIWGFGDGAFQFNFPDHTKLVVSADGAWIDFYHLTPEAATYLDKHGLMQTDGYETRGFLSYPTDILLRGSLDNLNWTTINRTNQLPDKIAFVADVVGRWIEHGGLGNLGKEDMGKTPTIMWRGLQECLYSSSTATISTTAMARSRAGSVAGEKKRKNTAKLVWVSVGAHGKDAEYVSMDVGDGPGTVGSRTRDGR